MAIDFPASPAQGQQFTPPGGYKYVYVDGIWRVVEPAPYAATAQRLNRLVNPALLVSQENGDNAVTANMSYVADQWFLNYGTSGLVTGQRVQVATPNGSKNRLRWTVNTAVTSNADNHFNFGQQIEGTNLADLLWGTPRARQVIFRFGFKAPAGTYTLCLGNSGSTRNYGANFVISAAQANTDTEQVIIVPGDGLGTWLTDNGVGLQVRICMVSGTTYRGVPGWQGPITGSIMLNTASTSNGFVAGNVFELWDAGLYVDPANTGVPPPWEPVDYAEELVRCRRYYEVIENNAHHANVYGSYKMVRKRALSPAIAFSYAGTSVNNSGWDAFHAINGATVGFTWTANSRL